MGKRSLAEVEATDVSMTDAASGDGPSTEKEEYEQLCSLVNPIASPLAGRKLAKKIYKLIKKAAKDTKENKTLRQGMRDVQKAIRKDEKGIMILAGNVSPIDVYSHMPAIAEEKDIPYGYTPSREHLGLATGQRRAAIILYIKPHEDYQELYDEVAEALNKLVVNAA